MIAEASLKLTIYCRVGLNDQQSSGLSLPSTEITNTRHHNIREATASLHSQHITLRGILKAPDSNLPHLTQLFS